MDALGTCSWCVSSFFWHLWLVFKFYWLSLTFNGAAVFLVQKCTKLLTETELLPTRSTAFAYNFVVVVNRQLVKRQLGWTKISVNAGLFYLGDCVVIGGFHTLLPYWFMFLMGHLLINSYESCLVLFFSRLVHYFRYLGRGQTNSRKTQQGMEEGEIAWSKLGGHTESRAGDCIAICTQQLQLWP